MRSPGFTLIEILIAITIMALISAIAVPSLNNALRTNTEGFARQVAGVFREARDRALLRKQIVRVKFDLKAQEYWAEEAPASYLIPSNAEQEKAREEKKEDAKEGEEKEQSFAMVRDITPKKRKVPYGVKIASARSPRYKETVSEGEFEVYYFPTGLSDAAILQIEDQEKTSQTVSVNPITGITEIKNGSPEANAHAQ